MPTRAEMIDKRAQAQAMYAAGQSKLAIADTLDVSTVTLRKWLGVTGRSYTQRVPKADLEALRKQRLTNSEIARRTGISRQRVAQVLGPVRGPHEKAKGITIRLPHDGLAVIRAEAKRLGYISWSGPLAGEGSVSGLLEAIAKGDVKVRKR